MEGRYRLTAADLLAAQRLHGAGALRRRAGLIALGVALIGLGAAVVGQPTASIAVVAAAVLVGMAGATFVWLPWARRRAARRSASRQEDMRVEATDAGLTLASPVSRASIDWAAFSRFREGNEVMLLYRSNGVAVPVPTRTFGDRWAEFVSLVRAHVPPDGSARRQ